MEYIQQLRHEGMELRPALLLAGRTRFRPILMTSMAAILGLFPLALGIGPGAQMQQPLAIMVIGGLTANMLFTRLVIPVGYLVLERETKKPVLECSPQRAHGGSSAESAHSVPDCGSTKMNRANLWNSLGRSLDAVFLWSIRCLILGSHRPRPREPPTANTGFDPDD